MLHFMLIMKCNTFALKLHLRPVSHSFLFKKFYFIVIAMYIVFVLNFCVCKKVFSHKNTNYFEYLYNRLL